MSRYDIHTICPLCNKSIEWINGKTNSNVVMIRTKRKGEKSMCSKAFINGIEVVVYDFSDDQALCYVPEVGVKEWFNMDMIEVRSV